MAVNLDIDERLIRRALKLGHHRTKKEAVTAALKQYIRRREQRNIARKPKTERPENLAEFFASSPLPGAGVKTKRLRGRFRGIDPH